MRQYYTCYNVTALVNPGTSNVVGVQAAAGWQSMGGHQLSVRGVLSVVDSAGKRTTVPTSASWDATQGGPVRYGNIYGGEVYDARLEMPWSSTTFKPTGKKRGGVRC